MKACPSCFKFTSHIATIPINQILIIAFFFWKNRDSISAKCCTDIWSTWCSSRAIPSCHLSSLAPNIASFCVQICSIIAIFICYSETISAYSTTSCCCNVRSSCTSPSSLSSCFTSKLASYSIISSIITVLSTYFQSISANLSTDVRNSSSANIPSFYQFAVILAPIIAY